MELGITPISVAFAERWCLLQEFNPYYLNYCWKDDFDFCADKVSGKLSFSDDQRVKDAYLEFLGTSKYWGDDPFGTSYDDACMAVANGTAAMINNGSWILAKLQGDVLNAEGAAIASLMQSVDRGDVRVNQLSAFVIPNSRNVMRGQKYEAQIVMAAIDSTQTPQIYIGDQLYDAEQNGYYSVVTTREGIQNISGYLEVAKPDGSSEKLPFETSYFVSEPLATVSNTMMNVMYAGIENPVSISVPGVAASQISASMTNGTLTRSGNGWVAKPKEVDKDAVITVTANQNGRSMQVSQMAFRVRRLPDPTPYIAYKDASGNMQKYKGGTQISKASLLSAGGIRAAIDDGLLNVEFQVKSFRVDIFDSMGNDIPEDSQTSEWSSRQLEALRRLSRGKTFFITRVKAVGPDGIERTLSPIQVIL